MLRHHTASIIKGLVFRLVETFLTIIGQMSTSGKTFASGAGGMGFKSRADQISYMLPTTRQRCNLEVWAVAQSRGDGHRSLVTPERVLSECNEDLI